MKSLVLVVSFVSIGVSGRPVTAQGSAPQVSPTGFLVRHTATIGAPPPRVYDALVRQVGSWWSPDHTFSGDAQKSFY